MSDTVMIDDTPHAVIGEEAFAVEQGSAAWFEARLGNVTASRIRDVVAVKKDGQPYAGYETYLHELLCERLTERAAEHFVSEAMERGTALEEAAALEYAMETGRAVETVGYCPHPSIERSGASPDRLIGSDGLLEIKCPNAENHLPYFVGASIPDKYWWQMQWQMECTDRSWCDFMSYDPRFSDNTPALVSKIIRVKRDDEALATARERVIGFIAELDRREAELRAHSEGAV